MIEADLLATRGLYSINLTGTTREVFANPLATRGYIGLGVALLVAISTEYAKVLDVFHQSEKDFDYDNSNDTAFHLAD